MKVHELIAKLLVLPAEMEVMIMDEANGGGSPRQINHGPVCKRITETHADLTADCEGREGEKIVVVGYGCY